MGGAPVMVTFEIRGGRGIFQGDIDLGPVEHIARTREELLPPAGPQRGSVVPYQYQRWPGGRIPYVFASNFQGRDRVESAIAHIQSKVFGVTFQLGMGNSDYIIFRPGETQGDCRTRIVGATHHYPVVKSLVNEHEVFLGDFCSPRNTIHELLHVLGFWHEQSRCDRDTYVDIVYENIASRDDWDQFAKHCPYSFPFNTFNPGKDLEEYDEGSIMHYGPHALGRVDLVYGRPEDAFQLQTIRSLRGRDALMGRGDTLSTIDRRTVNLLYPPYAPGGVSASGTTVSWSAARGALSYGVSLTVVCTEYNGDGSTTVGGGSCGYAEGGGYTTGLSFVDTQNSYTGTSHVEGGGFFCTVNCDGAIERWSADYYYEVRAFYPDGAVSPMARVPALVAPVAPPPDDPPDDPPFHCTVNCEGEE